MTWTTALVCSPCVRISIWSSLPADKTRKIRRHTSWRRPRGFAQVGSAAGELARQDTPAPFRSVEGSAFDDGPSNALDGQHHAESLAPCSMASFTEFVNVATLSMYAMVASPSTM
jgi:hypothetical protein